MKLHQLQALVGAVEHGSIRAAARAMHLTQAALTKSLRQLEDDNGVALLMRQSRGVALTPAGQQLHARARLIIRQLELAQDELHHALGDETGIVRAGLTPYLMLTVLGESFRWFRKRYPRVELRLMEGLVTRVLPALRDGSLDFAIVADSGEINSPEFSATRLGQAPQRLVVRQRHPALETASARQLRELEWVLPGPMAVEPDDGVTAMFARAGLEAPTQISRCDAMAAMALVRQSDAVSIMPAPLLAQPEAHGLSALLCKDLEPPSVELVLLTLSGLQLSPAAAYFARCLTDEVQRR
jgi:LysR family transcriptional regulator, regulator of abg operon